MKNYDEILNLDFDVDFTDYLYAESLTAWTMPHEPDRSWGFYLLTNK